MFTYPRQQQQQQQGGASAAVAMQEIEVVSMDDGGDNVTATSLSPVVASSSSSPSLQYSASSSESAMAYAAPMTMTASSAAAAAASAAHQDEAMEALLAMMSNERTIPPVDHRARSKLRATPISVTGCSNKSNGGGGGGTHHMRMMAAVDDLVNDVDRTKMCDWYYEMSDFLKIDRATASRSLTLLDRFMATPVHGNNRASSSSSSSSCSSSCSSAIMGHGGVAIAVDIAGVVVAASRDRDEYQLAALTALFLAIKLFERLNIQPEHVSYLSRGRYTSHEVVRMEMVMLAALEWRVSAADKVDYVDALLDVVFPGRKRRCCEVHAEEVHAEDADGNGNGNGNGNGRVRRCGSSSSSSSGSTTTTTTTVSGSNVTADPLLCSLEDLASLQVQLSDFDSSFSTQRQSTVAFAAVINAFELRKDGMSELERHMFLEGVQRLMNELYPLSSPPPSSSSVSLSPLSSPFSSRRRRKETRGNDGEDQMMRRREELAGTVERLRALVDPSNATRGSGRGGGSLSSSFVQLTPTTSHQEQHQQQEQQQEQQQRNNGPWNSSSGSSSVVVDVDNDDAHYEEVSPLDVALESMENFDVAQLLCCRVANGDDIAMVSDGKGPDVARLESAASFGSATAVAIANDAAAAATDDGGNKGHVNNNHRQNAATNNNGHSPTSIATILFGAAAAATSSTKKK